MVKNEQLRDINQQIRTTSSVSTVSLPPPPPPPPPVLPAPMLQTTSGILSQRSIDTNAMDITSLKGQFAWEKIPYSDTYMPVIFRNNTKYFCVRMLRKLLPDYPEDFIRRSFQYQYRKMIDIYSVTPSEIELLNRINGHHSRWTYSRQPFTKADEIVRVSDFLPYYEHLRHGLKPASTPSNVTVHTLRQLLPQSQQTVQRSSDFMNSMPTILRTQSTVPQSTSVPTSSYPPSTDFGRENISSTSRPIAPAAISSTSRLIASAANVPRPQRQPKAVANPYTLLLPPQSSQYPPPRQSQSIPVLLNNTTNFTNTVPLNNPSTVLNTTPISLPPSTGSSSSPSSSSSPIVSSSTNDSPPPPPPPPPSSSSVIPSSAAITNRKSSTSSAAITNRKSSTSSTSPTGTTLSTKTSRLHCGWLQINKLYTPYISPSATNHHLYKLPVSLLSFYDLLKISSSSSESKDSLVPFEQIPVTSQEIEMINELCVKQNIQPFNIDTKLIELSTFYKCCSANMLFIKELPLNEPKASICKDWSTIVQINGGICRLRNITTLHEQTVPFIGNNLLKNFIISSQCLLTASLSKPTNAEIEFLQLILFFSNMSINLRNAQLIDIQSVKKEYNVDLILLFNDKFPLNVLNYQQQGNRPNNTSQTPIIQANSTNTIAESTPPPSPPSPPTNQPQPNSTTQLPLTSSANRYYKTVQFHGHSLTAYICSGLGANSQRECVSIKSLCDILYPNSTSLDKLEMKMLKLLRSKNINRFRPQNQSLGVTRLIDVKDAEKYWDYIEQGMRSMSNDNEEVNIRSSISSDNSKASTVERVENDERPSLEISIETNKGEKRPSAEISIETNNVEKRPSSEISIETNKGEKRPLDEPFDEENVPILERINKRVRFAEKDNNERLNGISDNEKTKTNERSTDKIQKKRTIKLSSVKNNKKRLLPSTRTNRQSIATWVRKYNIEECCIQLNQYDPIYDSGTD